MASIEGQLWVGGRSAADLRVQLTAQNGTRFDVHTDDRGRFRLAEGPTGSIRLYIPEHDLDTKFFVPEVPKFRCAFQLPRTRRVRGTIQDRVSERPLGGVRVISLAATGALIDTQRTGANGRFSILCNEGERGALEVYKDGYIADWVSALEGQVIRLKPGAVLEGQVLTSRSSVAADSDIEVRLESPDPLLRPTRTDPHGRFRIAGLPPGTYRTRIRFQSGESEERQVTLKSGRRESGIWIVPAPA